MYNYSTKLNYRESDCDTLYRKELLECFNLKEYSDNINNEISNLYLDVKEYYKNIIAQIKKDKRLSIFGQVDNEVAFTILFSWEYFYENHQLLKIIHSNRENTTAIGEKQNALLDRIIKQNSE